MIATADHPPVTVRGVAGRLDRLAAGGATRLALVLLVALALMLRLRALASAEALLDVDEARLTLAAQGFAAHGLPLFPSGKLYTRGLLQSLAMAPSVALLQPLELAARLPSVVAGVATVLVVYLCGRQLAGRWVGLIAAALTATSVPLITYSAHAWLYSIFVLCWTLSLLLLDRAVATASARALFLAGLAVCLTFLTHEFAVALVPAFGVALLHSGAGRHLHPERLGLRLGSSVVVGVGLVLVATLSLGLRSDTAGGALSEIRGFLALRLDLDGLDLYSSLLLPGRTAWLLVPAALCAPLLASGPVRRRLLVLGLAAVGLLVLTAFFLSQRVPRYGLPLAPMLYLFAAVGLAAVAERLRRVLPGRSAAGVAMILSTIVVLGVIGTSGVWRSAAPTQAQATWVTRLYEAGYRPGDLVLSDTPTVTYVYLGQTDYWLRTSSYEKYVRQDGGVLRDIHTNAVLLRDQAQYRRMVATPHRGRTAWVIVWPAVYRVLAMKDDLRSEFEQRAKQRFEIGGWTVYQLSL